MGATQKFRISHTGKIEIIREDGLARTLGHRIDLAQRFADHGELLLCHKITRVQNPPNPSFSKREMFLQLTMSSNNFLRGELDSLQNFGIAGAAAEISRQGLANLVASRLRCLVSYRLRREEYPRD